MVRLTRRDALKAGAGAAGAGPLLRAFGTAAAQGGVETVISIPGERVPENLAVADDGTLYFGITAGEVWRLTAEQTQATGLTLADAERVGTLPGGAAGVEVVSDTELYVGSQAGADTGVWRVPTDGSDPSLYAAIPGAEAFPNDVKRDPERERLLVTESMAGVVYEVPLGAENPEATVWADHPLLDTESFGANGLTFAPDGSVYVAVTRATNDAGEDVGRLVRVPVADDGSAGEPEPFVESGAIFGADGITSRGFQLYVAANSRNEVVRVTPAGRTTVVATAEDGLVFPSDVVFGKAPRQRGDLFICNFANENPEQGAILRTRP